MKDDRSFADLDMETSKEMVVDNLLNRELEKERPSWMDKLLVVELSGEIKRAMQFPPLL
jgi:hypothetical protein